MRLTIKKYKSLDIGHEGGAWTCDLYVDGKLAAHVENRGDGGPTLYRWVGAYANTRGWDVPPDILDHIQTQPDTVYGQRSTLDRLVAQLLDELELAKLCRRYLVFTLPGDLPDTVHRLSKKYSKEEADYVKRRYPGAIILNERQGGN